MGAHTHMFTAHNIAHLKVIMTQRILYSYNKSIQSCDERAGKFFSERVIVAVATIKAWKSPLLCICFFLPPLVLLLNQMCGCHFVLIDPLWFLAWGTFLAYCVISGVKHPYLIVSSKFGSCIKLC